MKTYRNLSLSKYVILTYNHIDNLNKSQKIMKGYAPFDYCVSSAVKSRWIHKQTFSNFGSNPIHAQNK